MTSRQITQAPDFTFPSAPVPKPRLTRRDKWLTPPRPPVARYYTFANAVRALMEARHFNLPDEGAHFAFYIPMPKSWSKSARMAYRGTAHRQKPDIDNLLKAIFDAMSGNDCTIWHIASVKKVWADEGSFTISLAPQETE